jgi:hypothetical protein
MKKPFVPRFSGRCVGGPYDGRPLAANDPLFRITKAQATQIALGSEHPSPELVAAYTGTYHHKGSWWSWTPEGKGEGRS